MITIREGVILDENQRKVLKNIEPFTTGLDLEVTRGHDTPRGQLNTIAKYAKRNGVHFPEFDAGIADLEEIVDIPTVGRVMTWQRTWSKLLNIGVIINPPLPAVCLFPYMRPTGEQMQGKVIDQSPHIKKVPSAEEIKAGKFDPCAIDFSTKVNGVSSISLTAKILNKAKDSGAGIRVVKLEPKNGCVHIDTAKV